MESPENRAFIDEAIRRKLAAQRGGAGPAPAPAPAPRRRPAPELASARQQYRQRVMKRRKRAPRQSVEDMATELFTNDIITGSGEAAGPGIIPYASMPLAIRKQIPMDAPPVGWDPAKLSPKKRMLLRRLQALGAQEASAIQGQMGQ